jgi:hypothetical protein
MEIETTISLPVLVVYTTSAGYHETRAEFAARHGRPVMLAGAVRIQSEEINP